MKAMVFFIFSLVVAVPSLRASDEWDDLFQELNKEKAESSSTPAEKGSTEAASSAEEADPFAEAKPVMAVATESKISDANISSPSAKPLPAASFGKESLNAFASSGRPSTDKLLKMDESRVLSELESLERRVNDLERENRLMTERVRNLTRSVDDLKRKR